MRPNGVQRGRAVGSASRRPAGRRLTGTVRSRKQCDRVIVGMLTRYNRKTVTVITDDGQHWNVAPRFLRKAVSPASADTDDPNVIRLKPR